MSKTINRFALLAALAFGGATMAQAAGAKAASHSCCPGGKCGTCCVKKCTKCGKSCSKLSCCKK